MLVRFPPAVDDNWTLFRADSFPECPHEPADHDGHEHASAPVLMRVAEKTMIPVSWKLLVYIFIVTVNFRDFTF